MKILIACESSGKVRDAMIDAGHDCISADLLEGEGKYFRDHYKGDIFDVLDNPRGYGTFKDIDLMIAFPPCTDLCVSGARHFKNKIADGRQGKSIDFFMRLVNADIPKIAIENPVGIMSTRYRKPDQYIQPYQFGHDVSKKTCLWLKGLPSLVLTGPEIQPRIIEYKGKPVKRWGNQSPCGADNKGPSENRWKERSETYQGIANAMANQWGKE